MTPPNVIEILRTKLYRPRPPDRFLKRRRLLDQLEAGAGCPVSAITAPAGYGKTTLVAAWLAEHPHPACWLSLDGGDNDLIGFLTYLIAAIQTVSPQACPETAALLRALDPPFPALQNRLINELDLLPQKIIIVLDDYHFIQTPEIHNFLTLLVSHMPAALRLVICSRERLSLPVATWRARQQLCEISARELAFTPVEAEQFLRLVLGGSLASETLRVFYDKAEGWITGLQLAAYSLRNALTPAAFVRSFQKYGSQNIREFLLDQAFLCQPQPIQEFLLKTSILDRFSTPLCNALDLSGENLRSTQDTLDILNRASLFIVPLDEQGEWFRYHNLFAETLQSRLKNHYSPQAVASLYQRAVDWFEKNDYIDDAIQYALAAGDPQRAAAIIEKHSIQALNQERNATIDRWLAALPAELIETRPRLAMMRVWIESYRERGLWGTKIAHLVKMRQMIADQRERADAETCLLLDGYVSALWPLHQIYTGEFEQGIAFGEHALKILPAGHDYVRGRAVMGWALCMQAVGRGDEVCRYLLAEKEAHPEVNAYTLAVLQSLGCIYAISGKLDELEQTAACLLSRAEAHGFQILTGWSHYLLGSAAYLRDDLQAARRHFENAVKMQYLISKFIVRESLVGLCLVTQALGHTTEARAAFNHLTQLEGEETNEFQRSLQAHLALIRGEPNPGRQWSMTDPVTMPPYLFAWLEIPHFTQARLWVLEGKAENLERAVTLLAGLLETAAKMGSRWRMIESRVLLACALYQQGRRAAAVEQMEQAVSLARPNSFLPAFIEAGPLAFEILAQLQSRDSELAQALFTRQNAPRHPTPAHPLLTHREIEVLRLLDEHLSEREIAARLSVSQDTVKKHCYHIYNKLGVNRRREALAVAKEAGIL